MGETSIEKLWNCIFRQTQSWFEGFLSTETIISYIGNLTTWHGKKHCKGNFFAVFFVFCSFWLDSLDQWNLIWHEYALHFVVLWHSLRGNVRRLLSRFISYITLNKIYEDNCTRKPPQITKTTQQFRCKLTPFLISGRSTSRNDRLFQR